MKNERRFSRSTQWFLQGLLMSATGLALLGAAGCKSSSANSAPIIVGNSGAADPNGPADGGLAPVNGVQPTQVLGQSASYTPTQQSESYAQQPAESDTQQSPAPIVRAYQDPSQSDQGYSNQPYNNQGYNNQPYDNQGYSSPDNGAYNGDDSYNAVDPNQQAGEDALTAADIQTDQAPPPLPEYDQPPAPEPDYLWTPGYWAWGPGGYYWVPGVWCPPPYYGAYWTPPYWGWYRNHYWFHHGYWGPHVGFYGGIDYGFGYIGIGYFGGYWNHDHFYYNRSVTNVARINNTYVYNRTVVYNNVHYGPTIINRVSYNGGPRGLHVAPRPAERVAMREMHTAPLRAQINVRQQAVSNRSQFFAANHGRPAQVAMTRPIASNRSIAQPPPAVRNQMLHGVQPAGGFNHGGQPAQNQMRPGFNHQQPQHGQQPFNHGGQPAQNQMRSGVNNQQRPGFNQVQPGNQAQPARGPENFNRGAQQPAIQQRPAFNQPRPEVNHQPQRNEQNFARPQPQQQARPQLQQPRPQEQHPQPQQARPQPQFNRPQPQQAQPQMQQPRPEPARPEARPQGPPHNEGPPHGR